MDTNHSDIHFSGSFHNPGIANTATGAPYLDH
jgi:hypothetical protein